MAILNDGVTRHHAAIPALDGLRAAAIIIVICSHVGLERVMPGQFGVTLFFFLSGYLITTLLRREIEQQGRIDFRQFYLRRVVRIIPPMYITIAVMAGLSLLGVIHPLVWRGLPLDLTFLSNYFPVSMMPIGLWSLAVEEHYYLAFPLIMGLMARRFSFARCAGIFLALCAVVLALRFWQVLGHINQDQINFTTHTRIDSILFGSVLALWNNPVSEDRDVLPKGLAGYALAAALLIPTFAFRDDLFRQTYRNSVQGLGLLVLFNTLIRDRGLASAMLNNRLTKYIATLSYTLYLVHSGLIIAFSPDGSHTLPMSLAAIAVSVLYATAMHRWVERPLNVWRRRTERRWTGEEVEEAPVGATAPSTS